LCSISFISRITAAAAAAASCTAAHLQLQWLHARLAEHWDKNSAGSD